MSELTYSERVEALLAGDLFAFDEPFRPTPGRWLGVIKGVDYHEATPEEMETRRPLVTVTIHLGLKRFLSGESTVSEEELASARVSARMQVWKGEEAQGLRDIRTVVVDLLGKEQARTFRMRDVEDREMLVGKQVEFVVKTKANKEDPENPYLDIRKVVRSRIGDEE